MEKVAGTGPMAQSLGCWEVSCLLLCPDRAQPSAIPLTQLQHYNVGQAACHQPRTDALQIRLNKHISHRRAPLTAPADQQLENS